MGLCEKELIRVEFSTSLHELCGDNSIKMIKVSINYIMENKVVCFIAIESIG